MSTATLQFSTTQVLGQAWKVLREKWIFLLGVWAVIWAVSFGVEYLRVSLTDERGILTALSLFAAQVLSMLLGIGSMKVILKVVRNQKAEISEVLTAGVQYLWQYFLLSVVLVFVLGFGFLLLIIPGIVWAMKYMFASYFLIDDNLSFSEAMAASDKMTRGLKWQLFGFMLVLMLINLVGLLLLGVGLVFTLPVTCLSGYVLYTQLRTQMGSSKKLAK